MNYDKELIFNYEIWIMLNKKDKQHWFKINDFKTRKYIFFNEKWEETNLKIPNNCHKFPSLENKCKANKKWKLLKINNRQTNKTQN